MTDAPQNDTDAGPGPDKLLAMGAYGETVAAYRYLVLSEKAPTDANRRLFADMADEEQEHKQRLEQLLVERYPDSDFLLSPEDKDQVVTGPRLLDMHSHLSFAEVMAMMLQTEQKTASFYAKHSKRVGQRDLRMLFHTLAEEGIEHYQRLRTVAREAGAADSAPDPHSES